MKDPIIYIIESLVCGGVFMLIYRGLVIRCGSFGFARGYLIVTALLSLTIPLFDIPLWPGEAVYIEAAPYTTQVSALSVEAATDAPLPPAIPVPYFGMTELFVALYSVVAAAMLAVMVCGVVRIGRIRRGAEKMGGYAYNVYSSAKVVSPFSFMRAIYINRGLEGSNRDQIVSHESSHIRHGHHAEKLVMSLLLLLQWYNPFVWAVRKYMIELHEYQADGDVLAEGYDITEYRKLILEQVMGYNPDITCGLNGSLTKKRFIMMTRKRNAKNGWLRIGSTAIAAAGLTMLFSFTRMPDEYIIVRSEMPEQGTVAAPSEKRGKISDVLIVVDGEIYTGNGPFLADMIDMMIVTDHKSFTEKYGDAAAAGLVMIKTKAGDGTGYETTKREIQAQACEDYYGYDNKGNPIYSIEVKGLHEYADVNYTTYFMKTDEAVERYGDEVMRRYEQGAVAKTESAGTAIALPEKPTKPEPLLIVDGKVYENMEDIERIEFTDIDSYTEDKGPSYVEKYGEAAAGGVLIVNTKKGNGNGMLIVYKSDKPAEPQKPAKPSEPATAKPEKHKGSVIVQSMLIAKEPREFKLSGDIDSDGMMIIKTKDRRGVTVSLGRGGSTDTIEETKRSGDSLVYDVKNKLAHIYSDGHLVHVYRDDAAESLRDLMRQYFPGYVKEESKVGQTVEYYEKDVVVVNSSLEDDMERVGSASKVLNISTEKEGDTINYVVYELTPDESAKPDKPAKPEKPAESDTDAPFIIAEVMPAFRGSGIAEFRNWVAENVEYPADAGEGTVVVFFVIEKDGSLSGIKTLASPNSKLSDAVVKVLKTSPKWTPGMNEGEAVRVQFNMTVSFQAPTPEV